jgi:hypothetical protein
MIQNEINCHERWSFFFWGGGEYLLSHSSFVVQKEIWSVVVNLSLFLTIMQHWTKNESVVKGLG